MKNLFISTLTILSFFLLNNSHAITLKEMFDQASPQDDYDKYIELETGIVYTGGLLIGKVLDPITNILEGEEGLNVRIIGNGAILDLQGEQICISYCNNVLDIDDCVIINGNIRYRGINSSLYEVLPTGFVRYITFYKPHDYGIRIQGAGDSITVERNILVDAVDTGNDFIFSSGLSADWLPTGANVAISNFIGFYGLPELIDNWSFFSDEEINGNLINHFMSLCEFA